MNTRVGWFCIGLGLALSTVACSSDDDGTSSGAAGASGAGGSQAGGSGGTSAPGGSSGSSGSAGSGAGGQGGSSGSSAGGAAGASGDGGASGAGGGSGQAECKGFSDETTGLDTEEAAFLKTINEYRAQNGKAPLKACTSLNRAAQAHSEDMRDQNYFDHTGKNGSKFSERACDACYESGCGPKTAMGENIAAGNAKASGTFTQWKNSSGHNANMLKDGFKLIGIGRATGGSAKYDAYWTTVFGGKDEASCDLGERRRHSFGGRPNQSQRENGHENVEQAHHRWSGSRLAIGGLYRRSGHQRRRR